jgi:hypothetical protein
MRPGLSSDFGIYTTRVNNGSPARKKDEFANADAEKRFAFRRLLEKRQVILPVDGKLLKQLSSRRLQYDAKARIQLEPKSQPRNQTRNPGQEDVESDYLFGNSSSSGNPDIEKARSEFEHARKIEGIFHKDFDGDFTSRSIGGLIEVYLPSLLSPVP